MSAGNKALATFPVAVGDTVTCWGLSALSEAYYPGEEALAEDRVNYRFINGFVDVGDLPCRVALWDEVAGRSVELENDWAIESINLPGFNRRLEFSRFLASSDTAKALVSHCFNPAEGWRLHLPYRHLRWGSHMG